MPSSGQGYRIDFVLSDTPGNMDRISLRRIPNAEFVLLRMPLWDGFCSGGKTWLVQSF